MNVKSKIVVQILITFLIGVVAGAALNRALVRHRIKSLIERREAGLLVPFREEILKLAAPEKRLQIEEILTQHGRQLSEIHARFRQELEAAFESLEKEMAPLLTPEQKQRIKDMLPGPPPFPHGGRPGFGPRFQEFLPGGGMELQALRDVLDLSEEQAEKVRKILEDSRSRELELMKEGPGPDQMRLLREAWLKMESEVGGVLNDNQKELFRKFLDERRRAFPRRAFPIEPPVER